MGQGGGILCTHEPWIMQCPPPWAWGGEGTRLTLEEGGGGVWDPKVCVTKIAQSNLPFCKLRFLPRWSPRSGGGGRPPTVVGYNYAQLCTMHFDEDTRGLQTRGILGLPTFCRLAAGGTPRSSFSDDGRIASSCKASSAVERLCRCILVDKIVHDKHNNELHWTRVKQNVMHDYANRPNCELCTIMHDYACA